MTGKKEKDIRDAGRHFTIRRDQRSRRREADPVTEWYRQMVESAPDALILIDADGNILLANAQAERLFGYPREELLAGKVEMLVPVRYRDRHVEHRVGYFSEPNAREMGAGLDLLGLRKDGSEFPVEISLSPLRTKRGVYTTAAIRDATDRKKAQLKIAEYARNLERSNRELEQFAYVASHDLQAPLRNIASFSALLKREVQGKVNAEADEYFAFIEDSVSRMQELIADILQLSRVSRVDRKPERLDLRQPLEHALQQLKSTIDEKAALVEVSEMPLVSGDEKLLTQLFQNLIGNGMKFQAPDVRPVISVSAQREGDRWRVAVRDNGIGIEEKHQQRIFEIFQRLHTHEQYPGTGIGLALCKKIVEEFHDGEIGVESEPGKGTTFWFTLSAA